MTWGGKVSLKQQKGEQEEDANLANTWAWICISPDSAKRTRSKAKC